MAMTTQSLISGQSFGTSTNVGPGKFSISAATLAAATTAYIINVQVTPGAGPVDRNAVIRVWYTTTMRTVTAGNAPYTLGPTARFVDCPIGNVNAATGFQVSVAVSRDSSLEPKTGDSLHVWCDAPTLSTAAVLSVDVVEVPS